MQQESDDVMKVNSKTAEENMIITCRISSFWNEFFQLEYIDNKSKEKQTKNQYYCPDFIDRLKRFYLSTIPLGTKIMQNKVKKKINQTKSLQTYQSEQSLQKPIPMHKQRNVSK